MTLPNSSRPLILIAEELDPECVAWLAARGEVVECSREDPRFADLLRRADALIVRTYTRVDPALLAEAPRLRVVGRAGVGLDNIDLPACRARGIEVVHTPDANTHAVVELVTAFMLDALRPRTYLDRTLPIEEWRSLRSSLIAPRQLAGLTLGILGLGRVGQGVARVARAMDMRVLYNDLLDIPPGDRQGAESVAVDELFERADVLTVHIDDRPENRGFVDARKLALLRPGFLFINTSRGFVVDSAALADRLRADPSALAFLDVHDPEPFGPDYPLIGLPNARLTPHIGAATRSAHRNMSWVVRDVWRVLSGDR